jgi:hypothetical protein
MATDNVSMIRRADIEGSQSNAQTKRDRWAMFVLKIKNQASFPLDLHEIFVLIVNTLGHMRHHLTDEPLQQKLTT